MGDSADVTELPSAAEAFHNGSWMPCRVLDQSSQPGFALVRLVDEDGFHEVWIKVEFLRPR